MVHVPLRERNAKEVRWQHECKSCHHYLCRHAVPLPQPHSHPPAPNQNKKRNSDMFNSWVFFFSLCGFMGCISLNRISFPMLMGLGASIHQSLIFSQRQHSETKSAKMVSKCYKKRGRRPYFSIDKMSIFYSSIHKILLLASVGGGSVLLFVFQSRFLDF